MPSNTASNRTVRNRAKKHEDFETMTSTTSSTSDDFAESLARQRSVQMLRDKSGYSAALKKAKFKVHAQFSRKTVLSMRSLMPMALFKKIKRMMTEELGQSVLGTEQMLYDDIKALEYEYEGATFVGDGKNSPKVSVVRLSDVKQVIKDAVSELVKNNLMEQLTNCADNKLWLHVSGDKGGKSTKLVMQVLNCKKRQSVQSAIVLGMFEGDKDSRFNVGTAFGPLFLALEATASELKDLHISCPVFQEQSSRPEVTKGRHTGY